MKFRIAPVFSILFFKSPLLTSPVSYTPKIRGMKEFLKIFEKWFCIAGNLWGLFRKYIKQFPKLFQEIITRIVAENCRGNITLKEDTNTFYCTKVLFLIPFFSKNAAEKTPTKLNPFQANVPFLYPLRTSKSVCFSDVFRGYRSGDLVEIG